MSLASFGTRAAGLRLERMKSSPRYVDGPFRNTAAVAPGLKKGTVAPTISEFLCGGQRRTPSGPLPSTSPLPGWAKPPETGLRATWLGHSTVLLEIDGFRVLTDPVWGERASPVLPQRERRIERLLRHAHAEVATGGDEMQRCRVDVVCVRDDISVMG